MFNIYRPQPPGCPAGQVLTGNRAGALRGLEPGGRPDVGAGGADHPLTRSLTHLFAHLAARCGPGRQSGDSTRPGRQGCVWETGVRLGDLGCGWETGVRPGGQGGGASGQRALGLKFPKWGRQAQPTPRPAGLCSGHSVSAFHGSSWDQLRPMLPTALRTPMGGQAQGLKRREREIESEY